MKLLAVLALLLTVVSTTSGSYLSEQQYQRQFADFIRVYQKNYLTAEVTNKFNTFKSNLDLIEAHNANKDETSRMGINQFADLTTEEFRAQISGYRADQSNRVKNYQELPSSLLEKAPTSLDWRTKGAVTAVKDQGQCGSCWSFSATGSIEGAWFLAKGNLTSLSEQQLMDCSHPEGDDSCDGGLMDDAFQYVIDNKGICTEVDYPYKMKDEKCKTGCKRVATIKSFADVFFDELHPGNETGLMAAIQLGPVSIAIEADKPVFQLYAGGVVSSTSCGTNLDHGVLIVGYGTDAKTGLDYWIVKNSWSPTWGTKGYVNLVRNKNECGLNSAASYPIV